MWLDTTTNGPFEVLELLAAEHGHRGQSPDQRFEQSAAGPRTAHSRGSARCSGDGSARRPPYRVATRDPSRQHRFDTSGVVGHVSAVPTTACATPRGPPTGRVAGPRGSAPCSAWTGSRSPCRCSTSARQSATTRSASSQSWSGIFDVRISARSWNSVRTQPGHSAVTWTPGAVQLVGQTLGVGGHPGLDRGVVAHGHEPGGAGHVDDRAASALPHGPAGGCRRASARPGSSRRWRARAVWCRRW